MHKVSRITSVQFPAPSRAELSISSRMDFLDSLSYLNEFYQLSEWLGYTTIQTIFFIYLFRKYKHHHLIRSHTYDKLGLIILTRFTINSTLDGERDLYIQHQTDVANQLTQRIMRNATLVIIPLTIFGFEYLDIGHSNLLIYRDMNGIKKLEHYEPHGHSIMGQDINTRRIQIIISRFVEEVNSMLPHDVSIITYISSDQLCPNREGFQYITEMSSEKKYSFENGYCGVWCMLFTEFVLKNPTVPSSEILRIMYQKLITVSNHERYLYNVIRGYVNIIYDKLYKYFAFIGQKRLTIDRILTLANGTNNDTIDFNRNLLLYLDLEMHLLNNPGETFSGMAVMDDENQMEVSDYDRDAMALLSENIPNINSASSDDLNERKARSRHYHSKKNTEKRRGNTKRVKPETMRERRPRKTRRNNWVNEDDY